MIDILIPTYNREEDLIKNIRYIDEMVVRENVEKYFRLLISDNFSQDDTWESLKIVKQELHIELKLFRQSENIGLEKNAVFLLEEATADYIMYVGDDDFLPDGYLAYVVKIIGIDKNITAVIPGILASWADGTTMLIRPEKFDEKIYSPGFRSVLKLSVFGHQLSGLILKRESLIQNYLRNEHLRNIYLFIYFLSYNNLRGNSYYLPRFKVMVSQGNVKDWKYDDSGLLTEVFKNYKILYPNSAIKRYLLSIQIMLKQSSRLGFNKNFSAAFRSMFHLLRNKEIELPIKISLFFIYPYLSLRYLVFAIRKKII